MKKENSLVPFLLKIALALVLGFAAIVVSGLLYKHIPIRPYFPFIAEALLIGITVWLYGKERQKLFPLGLTPTAKNLGFLFLGLLIGVVAMLSVSWLRTCYTGEEWQVSTAIDVGALGKSLYYILPTVMVQELMFRGYLFTKTINRFGVVWSNVIFAFIFMLVHVLDSNVLQQPVQALFLSITIPVGHLWFATALLRSRTLLFPIGLHWGNNWAVQHLVGKSDNSQTLFFLTGEPLYTTWLPFVILLLIFNFFFLLVALATWKWRWSFRAKPTAG
ncbi:CPBP family intramembrane metalloprotease [Flavisolibacter sp. BT320]|nr:CPBP family intramembrane metalloprotease [Flavisolibacter longurius]